MHSRRTTFTRDQVCENAVEFSIIRAVQGKSIVSAIGGGLPVVLLAALYRYFKQAGDDEHIIGGSLSMPCVAVAIFIVVVSHLLVWCHQNTVVSESLLVLEDLGVQLKCKYRSGKEDVQFYDKAKIKAIVINEGITMQHIVCYIAFVVWDQKQLVIPFKNLNPKLSVLEEVYRHTKSALFEGKAQSIHNCYQDFLSQEKKKEKI
mmetsp:Transcript_16842/g.23163  ORF Transcript_16842/g.23163 Transcript_16842/m.23163 type:complete len:204 (-) Transcript_16842:79-690(-)